MIWVKFHFELVNTILFCWMIQWLYVHSALQNVFSSNLCPIRDPMFEEPFLTWTICIGTLNNFDQSILKFIRCFVKQNLNWFLMLCLSWVLCSKFFDHIIICHNKYCCLGEIIYIYILKTCSRNMPLTIWLFHAIVQKFSANSSTCWWVLIL